MSENELGALPSFSEIGAQTHPATATATATATNTRSAAASKNTAAAAPPVTVTNYSFPLLPLVLLAFVAGVVCSTFAKCMLDKREQMRRQELLIKPLLQVQN